MSGWSSIASGVQSQATEKYNETAAKLAGLSTEKSTPESNNHAKEEKWYNNWTIWIVVGFLAVVTVIAVAMK